MTVSVLPEPTQTQLTIHPNDLEWTFSRGSGPGGQNKNKTETAVDLKHVPTGVVVHCESERSQNQNKILALGFLRSRIWQSIQEREHQQRSKDRRSQIGTGQRGDKNWTVQVQNDRVTYHPTGQKFRLKDYLSGRYTVQK